MLSSKLRQAKCWSTNRYGLGCLLLHDYCNKTGRSVAEVLQEKHLDTQIPPVKNPICAAFEKYEEVPKTVPLDFIEDNVTWFASKISCAAGALGEEVVELRNWIIYFGCALEELRVVIPKLV